MRTFALMLFVGSLWLSACTGTPENNEGTTAPEETETMPDNNMQEDTTMMDTTGM